MDLYVVVLIVAAVLCGLVAGLLFGFAVVAMPGLGKLGDREFLRGFRAMDRIIQDRQPLFMLTWAGSVVAVIAALILGWSNTDGTARLLLVLAAAVYVLGVQLPTAAVNIPLNNQIQAIDPSTMAEPDLAVARAAFEARWNRWNAIRTFIATSTTALLLVLIALA